MKLPQSMTAPDVQKLFQLLGKNHVRFVGGCVRNMLMGIPTGDIDLATTLPPDVVIKKLSAAKIKVVPTGIDHGTVTAVLGGVGYEITTLRRDVETDGRRAVVAYTTDWAEDAARRDFTINALYADLDGKIYDPLGTGLQDIERFKVVFVGDAELRIQEDYLRILRFFRFHSLYGKGAPDKKGLVACTKFASKISTLSRERVTQEFTKILMGGAPQNILNVMWLNHILPEIFGKSFHPDRIGSLVKIQKATKGVASDVIFCVRLFTVLGFQFRNSAKLSNVLILNKKQISILLDLSKIKIDTKRIEIINYPKILYQFSRTSVQAAMMVSACKDNLSLSHFRKIWEALECVSAPQFPLSGKDLMAAGMEHGTQIGVELSRLEKIWIKSGFTLRRKDLMGQVKV